MNRKRGRPKGSKNKPKTDKPVKTKVKAVRAIKVKAETNGKRGRPKGSKNIDGVFYLKEDIPTNLKVDLPSVPKKRGRPKKIKTESEVDIPSVPKKRGRPKGSKNKTKEIVEINGTKEIVKTPYIPTGGIVKEESNYINLIKEHQITISKTDTELEPFPAFTKYKQVKRQFKLIDEWLIAQALNEARNRKDSYITHQFGLIDVTNMSVADREALNEYIWGFNDKGEVLVRKKRGKIKVPTESITESTTESTTENDNDVEEPIKRKRGRPRKNKSDDSSSEIPLIVSTERNSEDTENSEEKVPEDLSHIRVSKALGYCPNGCNAILGDADRIGPRKVSCYRCDNKVWIKDLLSESSRERPSTEREYYESSVNLDFSSELSVPLKPSKPLFTEDVVEVLNDMSRDSGDD